MLFDVPIERNKGRCGGYINIKALISSVEQQTGSIAFCCHLYLKVWWPSVGNVSMQCNCRGFGSSFTGFAHV